MPVKVGFDIPSLDKNGDVELGIEGDHTVVDKDVLLDSVSRFSTDLELRQFCTSFVFIFEKRMQSNRHGNHSFR